MTSRLRLQVCWWWWDWEFFLESRSEFVFSSSSSSSWGGKNLKTTSPDIFIECKTYCCLWRHRKARFERNLANHDRTLYRDYIVSKHPASRVTSLKHVTSAEMFAHDYMSTLHPQVRVTKQETDSTRLGDSLSPPPPPSFASAGAQRVAILPVSTGAHGSWDSLRSSRSPSTVTSYGRAANDHIYEVPRFCSDSTNEVEREVFLFKNHHWRKNHEAKTERSQLSIKRKSSELWGADVMHN